MSTVPYCVWMHVRAPHGREAFGLGRLRAADPAGLTAASPTTSTAASLPGEEDAAAVGGGGGCCCCWERRLLLLGEDAASHCCRWISIAGVPPVAYRRCGSRPDSEWPSRCRPWSESLSPGAGCAARLDRRYVYAYSQCADPGLGPGEAVPPRQS
jgi:hypothetical protein